MADKKFVHVLITATYGPTAMPVPSSMLSAAVGDMLLRTEEVHNIVAYSMPYGISPVDCGLREAWGKFDESEREVFADQFPDLATAIALMVGVDDEGKPGTASDSPTNDGDARSS